MPIVQALLTPSSLAEKRDDLSGSTLSAIEDVDIAAWRSPTSARSANKQSAVLIPAWNPEPNLLQILRELAAHEFGALIVVDDGSGAASASVFAHLQAIPSVYLLRHEVNFGKGRALKTGIQFFLAQLSLPTLITADADGQHLVEDIVRVAAALCADSRRVVLGVRVFNRDVPLRSRFGNLLTRRIFRLLTGVSLADTQTGLRAFPRHLLPRLLALEGDRYEYEMAVLAYLCRNGATPIEVPIRTVYLEGNRSSHFHPIRDSLRIYSVLLHSCFSSLRARTSATALPIDREASGSVSRPTKRLSA